MDHRLMVMWPKTGADLVDPVQLKACVVHWRSIELSMELQILIRGPCSFNRIKRKHLIKKVAAVACLSRNKREKQHFFWPAKPDT
jgi:hypothetical protein